MIEVTLRFEEINERMTIRYAGEEEAATIAEHVFVEAVKGAIDQIMRGTNEYTHIHGDNAEAEIDAQIERIRRAPSD